MIILKNSNYEHFLYESSNKKIIIFGTGQIFEMFCHEHAANIGMMERITVVLDNDPAKSGTKVNINTKQVPILSPYEFAEKNNCLDDYVMLLMVNNRNIIEIIDQLDSMALFDNMLCFYGPTAVSWTNYMFVHPRGGKITLPKCEENYEIPKIIHCIWFGKNPLSEIEKQCIESWKEICPDYEIKFWNEDSYDLSKTPLYVRQAYDCKKYAFVSDYARLDVVYQYGGFYLDTDVLLLRSLDAFRKYKAVYGYLPYNNINTGLGFGSVKGNFELKEQMELYEKAIFDNGSTLNMIPCTHYTTEYFRNKGLDINNRIDLIDGSLFLPSDFLCSLTMVSCNGVHYLPLFELSVNSYALHYCTSSWFEQQDFSVFEQAKEDYAVINKRLLNDWRRSIAL